MKGYFEELRAREEAEQDAREAQFWSAFTWGMLFVLVVAALLLLAAGPGV